MIDLSIYLICRKNTKMPPVSKLSRSNKNKKERWACSQCNRSYSRKHDLERHVDIAHTVTEDKPFRCKQCKYVFDSEDNLRAHENEHDKEETKLKCEICDKGFKSRNTWKRHMRAHFDPSPFACEVCKRRFGREHDMHRHTLRMHSGERQYQCDLCPSKFAWFSDLTIHKRRHNVMRKYRKSNKLSLRRTLPRKSKKKKPVKNEEKSPSEGSHVCKICSQSFTTFSAQQLHTCNVPISSEEEDRDLQDDAMGDLNKNNFRRKFEIAAALEAHSYHSKPYSENSESEAEDSNMPLDLNNLEGTHSLHNDVDESSESMAGKELREESVHVHETGGRRDLETTDITNGKYSVNQTLSLLQVNLEGNDNQQTKTGDILTDKVPDFQKTLLKDQCFRAVEGEDENSPETSNLDESELPDVIDDKEPLVNSNTRNSAITEGSDEKLQTASKYLEQTHGEEEDDLDTDLMEKEHAGHEISQTSNGGNSSAKINEREGRFTDGFKCKVCLNVFPKFSSLQLHLCGENLEEINLIEKSPKDTTTKTKKILSRSEDLNIQKTSSKSHLESGRNSVISTISIKTQQQNSTDTVFFTCGECHLTFSKISKLKKHSLEKHNKPLMLSCSVCQKEFRTKSKLERHCASHEKLVTHSCEDCGKTFKYKRDMERHKEQHTDEKKTKLKCNFCPREFFRKHDLDRHIENIHPAKAPYRCELCLAGFGSAEQLEKHLPEHAATHPHICWECQRGFRTIQNLKRHLVLHSDERPFSCSVCKRGFNRKYDMFQHMRIHRTERMECKHCDRKFVSGDGLRKHVRKKHS